MREFDEVPPSAAGTVRILLVVVFFASLLPAAVYRFWLDPLVRIHRLSMGGLTQAQFLLVRSGAELALWAAVGSATLFIWSLKSKGRALATQFSLWFLVAYLIFCSIWLAGCIWALRVEILWHPENWEWPVGPAGEVDR